MFQSAPLQSPKHDKCTNLISLPSPKRSRSPNTAVIKRELGRLCEMLQSPSSTTCGLTRQPSPTLTACSPRMSISLLSELGNFPPRLLDTPPCTETDTARSILKGGLTKEAAVEGSIWANGRTSFSLIGDSELFRWAFACQHCRQTWNWQALAKFDRNPYSNAV